MKALCLGPGVPPVGEPLQPPRRARLQAASATGWTWRGAAERPRERGLPAAGRFHFRFDFRCP